MDNPWTTLGTRLVYENAWLRLREDRVRRPDGAEGIYGVVEIPASVGIVAVDAAGRLALVEQWRYVHARPSIEIPTGGSQRSDPDLMGAARRELAEETGVRAARWQTLGSIDNSNGTTTDIAHLFLATTLTVGEPAPDADEVLRLLWVDLAEVVAMVLRGEITESVTVAAVCKIELLRRDGQLAL